MSKKVLVTGAAGFIGFHTVSKLIASTDYQIVGLDNINDYYPMTLKFERLKALGIHPDFIRYGKKTGSKLNNRFDFIRMDLADEKSLTELFQSAGFDYVIHLAAQAGVRYSIDNPNAYIQSNVVGFNHILEACRTYPVEHLAYASSSSVYGLNKEQPFSVDHKVDQPASLYAATKKSNELMAHTYSHLFKIPTTGLRFFTVYGPWGRPDMAPMLFAKAIMNGDPINVYNNGKMSRDFTYVDDIVNGVCGVVEAVPDENENGLPYRIFNIGNSSPVQLMEFIEVLGQALGKEVQMNFMPMQDGDVVSTYADISQLREVIGYEPKTDIKTGVGEFVEWYKQFYK
ncbi:NAD-dependent epimerase/dehydratase family protein [Marinoscillum furvescens]|uniref:UDP-glucuronate 4-epimerase n=1 Tax=Marinoscillum furvescens DSM 4134 TaxID=1122208 RepID=A0A3D9L1S7_MARFU|nr:NAD-dependent epimerase/dehydratase family protein [Marinoscillum furvescens]RED97995.1 UDP-glucuronate 4-epimerase [Marinoscillum furvescens DSM 4134]